MAGAAAAAEVITAVVAAGSAVYEGESQADAYEAQENQQKAAQENRAIQRADNLKHILSSQVALASSQGIKTSSPSFHALTTDEFNKFAQDDKASRLSLKYADDAYDDQIDSATFGGYAGAAESLFDAGTSATASENGSKINQLPGSRFR